MNGGCKGDAWFSSANPPQSAVNALLFPSQALKLDENPAEKKKTAEEGGAGGTEEIKRLFRLLVTAPHKCPVCNPQLDSLSKH